MAGDVARHASRTGNGHVPAQTNGHAPAQTNGHVPAPTSPPVNGHAAPETNGHGAPAVNGHVRRDLPVPRPREPRTDHPVVPRRRRVVRRGLDLVLAGLALLALSVLMLVIALLVRATSPGPALFRQTRVGQHGRPFRMLKFRTMTVGCDDELHRAYVTRLLRGETPVQDGGVYKLSGDPRVTRLGRFLRKTSLDELPQLINVVRGEMSLVGPRPMLPWEVDMLTPVHRERFAVPAGITGLWQVSGRSALTMTQALDLDVRYARTASLMLDLWILVKTVWVVLVPRGRAQ